MSGKDQTERKRYIQIIEHLYPPDSKFPTVSELGDQFMLWSLKRFLSKFKKNWRELDEEILKDMAYFCERHEEMIQDKNKDKL